MPTLAVALLAAQSLAPNADDLAVAWLRDGRVVTRTASADALPAQVPLGSLWKLFVFAYAVETGLPTPSYRCADPRRPDEEYCCEPGRAVGRDRALARSCGLFFEPQRLRIESPAWNTFWERRATGDAAWLRDLDRLRPDTRLGVAQILRALEAVPPSARAAASRALLPVMIDGYGRGSASHLGGLLRAKTFSWSHPERPGAVLGGAAGWLVDGTPVWLAGSGASHNVLQRDALRLSAWLPAPRGAPLEEACVAVDYFERYPIRSVTALPGGKPAIPGLLHGRFRVLFENGNALAIESAGELHYEPSEPRPRIRARLPLSDYLARVIDREADPNVTEAARALAVVARTWLLQNAPFEAGCYRVADSTRTQRVSPNAPSAAARAAAVFTDGLVLKGESVHYHLDQAGPGVLAWRVALEQARAGQRFDAILAAAFPHASLAAATGEEECRHLPEAEAWLARAVSQWHRRLSAEPGFEPLTAPLSVCSVDYGSPYSDREHFRVYVRGASSREDRITLAHEYLHLVFRLHPKGRDEDFIEALARSLVE